MHPTHWLISTQVKTVDESGGAHAAGCRAGDRVVATSATLGDAMWPKSSIAGVVSAVRSRLQLGNQKVSLRIERSLLCGNQPVSRVHPIILH